MRPDMKKVVVERPRWGSRQRNHKFGARLKYIPGHDYDEQPKKPRGFESFAVEHGGKFFEKEFTDVLGPLQRFLRKNVGRPWDKVYSEICSGLDRRKVTGLHIFQHVEQFVEKHCYFNEAGRPYRQGGWGGGYPVRWFYVHPRTGLLAEAPNERLGARKRRRARALAEKVTLLRVSDAAGYQKHEGIWYCVKLSRIKVCSWRAEDAVTAYDIFHKKEVSYGYGEHWIATEKKQCNRDELKDVQRLLRRRAQKLKKI